MSHLPVELVRDILESSARLSMVSDARWVGQSLAIASRAVYAWVAPILFESCYITPAKLGAYKELVSSRKLPGVAYARTFVVDDPDHSMWKTPATPFLSGLDCAKLQTVAVPDAIFQQLCGMPHFRPRVIHVVLRRMLYLPLPRSTLQFVFSRLTHICARTTSTFASVKSDFDMAGYLPEVTHIIIEAFSVSAATMRALQRLLAELPKLQRLLVGAYPNPPDRVLVLVGKLADLGDKRVYHGWNLERVTSIDLDDPPALRPKSLARLARDGHDIWMRENLCYLTRPARPRQAWYWVFPDRSSFPRLDCKRLIAGGVVRHVRLSSCFGVQLAF